ncbi:MAG: hypothetical protein ACLFU8_15615 [Anaerolineales bacterium]
MAAQDVLNRKIDEVTKFSADSEEVTDFEEMDLEVRALENMARETFQALVEQKYTDLVLKLESGDALTEEEKQVLELLIVGAAEYYLQEEEQVDEWREEIDRLLGEMKRLKSENLLTVDAILELQALCKAARRVLPDLVYYLTERRRVERFKDAMSRPLDPVAAQVLADTVRGMMSSSKM